jgi:hypothetical protein
MSDVAKETDLKQQATNQQQPALKKDEPALKPYPFATMGKEIAAALTQAAADQVTEAQNLHERAKVVAESIEAQIAEQFKLVDDMNNRLRNFGQSILNAHHEFVNGKK